MRNKEACAIRKEEATGGSQLQREKEGGSGLAAGPGEKEMGHQRKNKKDRKKEKWPESKRFQPIGKS